MFLFKRCNVSEANWARANGRTVGQSQGVSTRCPHCAWRNRQVTEPEPLNLPKLIFIDVVENFLSEELRADFVKLREYAAKNLMSDCEEEPLL